MGVLPNNNGNRNNYVPPSSLSDINVTPLVDVMLVLLIVFMISAPLMQQGVQVDLPKTDASSLSEQEQQIVLVIKRNKRIFINKEKISTSKLRTKLRYIFKQRKKKEIFIQADQYVNYGFVADVMSLAQRAGVHRIGLVTMPKEKKSE